MPHEKSCGIVAFRMDGKQRKYLVLHYEESHWDFPKGHVEEGEAEKQAAVREMQEETGITDLDFVSGFRERIEYFYKKEGKTMHKEVFFFLAETKAADVALSFEHIGFEWLPYEEALARITFGNSKGVLEKAEHFIKTNIHNL